MYISPTTIMPVLSTTSGSFSKATAESFVTSSTIHHVVICYFRHLPTTHALSKFGHPRLYSSRDLTRGPELVPPIQCCIFKKPKTPEDTYMFLRPEIAGAVSYYAFRLRLSIYDMTYGSLASRDFGLINKNNKLFESPFGKQQAMVRLSLSGIRIRIRSSTVVVSTNVFF
jgi:hypothetical protein